MAIKSAGTYMQISDLCKSCSKQNFCGNVMTNHYCTGYAPITYQYHTDIKVPPFTDGQKQLIEMTEKLAEKCDKISTNVNKCGRKNICDVDGIDDDITDIKELLNDTIKRIEEPTNEDWFCSLSTKEKAKWLSQRSQILYDCGQRDVFPKIMYEEDWEWWLKEIHE